MTELIDEFQPKFPKGRNKALVLLILTSLGSALKLAWAGLIWSLVSRDAIYMSKDEKFVILTVTVVCICGMLNFTGSFLMFRRKSAGIWLYLASQFLTVLFITWCTLAVNPRLQEDEQLFLLAVYVITAIYVVLYLANRKYWSTYKNDNDRAN